MIQLAGIDPKKRRILTKSDFERLSCEHLKLIDSLWSEASQGKFGIRSQIEVWKSVGGTTDNYYNPIIVDEYKHKVGWDQQVELPDSNDDAIPEGHLPSGIIAQGIITTPFFMERLEQCDRSK